MLKCRLSDHSVRLRGRIDSVDFVPYLSNTQTWSPRSTRRDRDASQSLNIREVLLLQTSLREDWSSKTLDTLRH